MKRRGFDRVTAGCGRCTFTSAACARQSHGARGGGKLQYGSAWWFMDQLDGMTAQLKALSNMGLLSRFVGMVTDSRSFLSYSRHEYFRRLQDICFFNARAYLGLELGSLGRGIEPAAA